MKIAGYPTLTPSQGALLQKLYDGALIGHNHLPLKGTALYTTAGFYTHSVPASMFQALLDAGAIVEGGRRSEIGTTFYRAVPNPAECDAGVTVVFTGSWTQCRDFIAEHYAVDMDQRERLFAGVTPGNTREPCYLVCTSGHTGWVREVVIAFMTPRLGIEVYHLEDPNEDGDDPNEIPE